MIRVYITRDHTKLCVDRHTRLEKVWGNAQHDDQLAGRNCCYSLVGRKLKAGRPEQHIHVFSESHLTMS